MKDLTEGKLDQELEYAKSIDTDSLRKCIDRLKQIDEHYKSETSIFTDFAPHSFGFERKDSEKHFIGNGGIIFHDITKGVGTAGSPSFSVSLDDDPKPHWSIHT